MEVDKVGSLTHLFVTVFMWVFAGQLVMPAITDVTMAALCPATDECSLAIYLSGFQQVVGGIGSVVITPLMGNLSDVYGRKALLTPPLTLSIFPLVVLAYSRATNFFYVYYVLKTLTSMIFDASVQCLCLAYVADNISESKRASAFGILAGVCSAGFVCGTLAARLLSTAQTFQVAAFTAMAATAYMRIFLKETTREGDDDSTQSFLKSEPSSSNSSRRVHVFKNIPTIHDIKSLLQRSKTFSQVTVMVLFNGLAMGGLNASLMYFLKARFHFSKNQYANLMLISGIAGTVSQLFLMPALVPVTGEETLLRIGLFLGCTAMILESIAWETWVIYVAAGFSTFIIFADPCMRSIASKQVGANEQGRAQGFISGTSSLSNIISPLIFSPLTATFLSDRAPFYFPGFSLLLIACCLAIAFIQSLMIRAASQIPIHKVNNNNIVA